MPNAPRFGYASPSGQGRSLGRSTLVIDTGSIHGGRSVSSRMFRAGHPSRFGIDMSSAAGRQSGLLGNSSCAGKSAYFQAGSLQLVVVPEPTGIAAGACGLGVMLVLRRWRVEGSPQKISKWSACDVAWLPNSHR